MIRRRLLIASLFVLFVFPFAAAARADTVPLEGWGPFPMRPGDILRAEFDVRWLGADVYQPSNVLLFMPGVTVIQPIAHYTTRLYDGGQLLGTYTGDPNLPNTWFGSWFKSPDSIFTRHSPTVIDFTSFQNGTFNGAVEFEIDSGLANIYRASDELDLDRALSADVASGAGFAPRTFMMIRPDVAPAPVPEPATLLLCGAGLAVLLKRRLAF